MKLQSNLKKIIFLALVAPWVTGCDKGTSNINTTERYFVQNTSKNAFLYPIQDLNHDEEDLFIMGKSFFSIPWVEVGASTTARDGLGPLFSANTCKHCHPRNGAGVAVNSDGSVTRSLLVRLAHQKSINKEILSKVGFMPDSTYGSQLSSHGTGTIKPEGQLTVEYEMIVGKYPDGLSYTLRKPIYSIQNLAYGAFDKETIIAPRIGSALVGLGLLERISEKDLLKNEDINDENRDGISGKANYTFDPETNTTLLGRFTWKASATSIKHQSAAAAHNDMGLSNPLFPTDNCSDKQIACQEVSKSKQKELYALDLPQHRLDAITFYLQNLAVPKQREIGKHKEGEALFEHLSCVKCHVSNFTTTDGVKINPYSDLLLHNMGEALADGRSEFLATGTEWRTAPLWGIGLRQKVSGEANFLHDGRARTIEEAILWHGGEAQKSKEAFMQLSKKQREKLLLFLQTI